MRNREENCKFIGSFNGIFASVVYGHEDKNNNNKLCIIIFSKQKIPYKTEHISLSNQSLIYTWTPAPLCEMFLIAALKIVGVDVQFAKLIFNVSWVYIYACLTTEAPWTHKVHKRVQLMRIKRNDMPYQFLDILWSHHSWCNMWWCIVLLKCDGMTLGSNELNGMLLQGLSTVSYARR